MGGKDPFLLPLSVLMFCFLSSFPFVGRLSWVVYTHACAHTNTGAAVYFIFVVYVCSGKRTHGALHVLMEKPLDNK